MKKNTLFFLISFFLLHNLPASSQDKQLSGAIVVGNAEVMSYKVYYKLKPDNTLTGFSVTDENGKEETKASLSGYFNTRKKVLFFQENKVLETKSNTPFSEFCLMKVTGKLEKRGQNEVYIGKFRSISSSQEIVCDSGSIMLMSQKTIEKLKTATEKLIGDSGKKEEKPVKIKDPEVEWVKNEISLLSGQKQVLKMQSSLITLDLVDDRFQDGDKITLRINDSIVAKGLEITNKVRSFKFQIREDERVVNFKIIAEDEGEIALTTVKAVLRSGNEVNIINITMNKSESVEFILKK